MMDEAFFWRRCDWPLRFMTLILRSFDSLVFRNVFSDLLHVCVTRMTIDFYISLSMVDFSFIHIVEGVGREQTHIDYKKGFPIVN